MIFIDNQVKVDYSVLRTRPLNFRSLVFVELHTAETSIGGLLQQTEYLFTYTKYMAGVFAASRGVCEDYHICELVSREIILVWAW